MEVAPGVGYWISLDAQGLAIGSGFHARTREYTASRRAAVDDEASGAELTGIVAKAAEADFEIGDQVRMRPRGVAADQPRLDLMRVIRSRTRAPMWPPSPG